MKVLITGARGQVGSELLRIAPLGTQVRACARTELDIADVRAVREAVTAFRPDLIVNAAAYTAVDGAERDRAAAQRVNVDGVRHLAEAALKCSQTRLIHLSTDFVFDGRASSPYRPAAPTAPLNVYGSTKRAGEEMALETLDGRALIVRTAWLYAAQGCNFLLTLLRLMREQDSVSIVNDQIGTPTATRSLAQIIWKFAFRPDLSGIFHWTDGGEASWYDFAAAIAEEGAALGLLKSDVTVRPIATSGYPTAARRPAYSVLDLSTTSAALGVEPLSWRVRLRSVLKEIALA